jgi:nucleoside-diphosphate-sugar epimerase
MAMKKRVLVTGADGFIGSHLVERLVRRGYPVRAMAYLLTIQGFQGLHQGPDRGLRHGGTERENVLNPPKITMVSLILDGNLCKFSKLR